jgi:putative ABC transport system permease protein
MPGNLAYSFRALRRSPGFTIVAVLTLALGLGANSAIFRVADAAFLRPVPAPSLDRVVAIREDLPDINLFAAPLSPLQADDLARRRDLFTHFTALTATTYNLTGIGEPRRVAAIRTSGDFFELFSLRPALGRFYGPSAGESDRLTAVLSHAFWRQISGGDPRLVGRKIDLNGVAHEVAGVLPPDFRYPRSAEVFVPFHDPAMRQPNRRGTLIMTALARLQPGVTADRLRAQLDAEVKNWPEGRGGRFRLVATPFIEYLSGALRPAMRALTAAVALVLLIVCANLANLQLVRTTGRRRDLAVRTALGAGRGRILGQILGESALVAVAGAALGLIAGEMLLAGLARVDRSYAAVIGGAPLDVRAFAFQALVAAVAALAFGLIPAIRATGGSLDAMIRASGRMPSAGRHRLIEGFAVAQTGLALALLIGAALMVRSLDRLLAVDPGFRRDQVTTFRVALPRAKYNQAPLIRGFYDRLLERLRATPGVESAGLSAFLPLSGGGDSSPFSISGREPAPGEPARHANIQYVGGDYFRAMGIPLRRGRYFTEADHAGAPLVCLIDERLAREYFGGEEPIGRRLVQGRTMEIVGVVGETRTQQLAERDKPSVYWPYSQHGLPFATVVVRSALDPASMARLARALVRELDRELPVDEFATVEEIVAQSVGSRRLATGLLGGFASLAVGLALLGVYGVLSHMMRQRTAEIGVRIAVGATTGDVFAMAIRRGLRIGFLGVAVGAALAGAGGPWLAGMLHEVSPFDAATWIVSVAAMTAVAVAASLAPARRAARIDPVVALRCE